MSPISNDKSGFLFWKIIEDRLRLGRCECLSQWMAFASGPSGCSLKCRLVNCQLLFKYYSLFHGYLVNSLIIKVSALNVDAEIL